ncbi:uncharacterized protein yc1106_02354 [Curvularia clavata]|uniref:DUF6590 domain-containing protein n=1 Tax=Curvularia clavata TaxID=95742 RepID=A0A9Q8Z4M7_CURCL|nr:uncharacterized protein yc1106_02354 [Curvularia clavata]
MVTPDSEPEWNQEYQRYLYTRWNPEYGRYYRTHYVEGEGWVLFDWLPAPVRSDSPHEVQAVQARPASSPPVEGPQIVGTYDFNKPAPNSHVEPLDSSYYVRSSSFFVVGRVFSVLFSEAAGATATPYNDSFSCVKHGELVYSQIRRFIVVSTRHGFCYAVPIFTYGNQATTKRGVDPSAHSIAYSMGSSYTLLRGESTLEKQPICIMMAQGVPSLSVASRIFFGIHHAIQHNVKVKDIGQVHPNDLRNLLSHWKGENLGPDY